MRYKHVVCMFFIVVKRLIVEFRKNVFCLMKQIESESNIHIKSNHDFHWIHKVNCLKIYNAKSKVVQFDWVISFISYLKIKRLLCFDRSQLVFPAKQTGKKHYVTKSKTKRFCFLTRYKSMIECLVRRSSWFHRTHNI